MVKISEADVELKMVDRLQQRRGLEFVFQQVYISGKRIDIVYKDKEADDLIAIEVKLSNWKSALRQANLNKFAIKDSYVALWHEHAKSAVENIQYFTDVGVGLIVVDSEFRMNVIIRPRFDSNQVLCTQYQHDLKLNLSSAHYAV